MSYFFIEKVAFDINGFMYPLCSSKHNCFHFLSLSLLLLKELSTKALNLLLFQRSRRAGSGHNSGSSSSSPTSGIRTTRASRLRASAAGAAAAAGGPTLEPSASTPAAAATTTASSAGLSDAKEHVSRREAQGRRIVDFKDSIFFYYESICWAEWWSEAQDIRENV